MDVVRAAARHIGFGEFLAPFVAFGFSGVHVGLAVDQVAELAATHEGSQNWRPVGGVEAEGVVVDHLKPLERLFFGGQTHEAIKRWRDTHVASADPCSTGSRWP